MPYYAQLDDAGTCTAITEAAGTINAPNMIPVAGLDHRLLGQRWDGAAWSPPAAAPRQVIARDEFLDLLGPTLEMVLADMATPGGAKSDRDILVWWNMLNQRSRVRLDTPQMTAGVAALVTKGLITQVQGDALLRGESVA